MNAESIARSNQEQATASWINQLNQLRLDELAEKLTSLDINLSDALRELGIAKIDIDQLISSNRGGSKGMHGFIAERTEVGFGNAEKLINGLKANYEWLNNNGAADMLRDGTEIQQKFVQSGGHFGLEAIREHLSDYPDFLKRGGKYQIPKDFYDALNKYLSMPEAEAQKLTGKELNRWKFIQDFFAEGNVSPNDIEPSLVNYDDVQSGVIDRTFQNEEQKLNDIDKARRADAHEQSKPTLNEGLQATAVSAVVEGGMALLLGIARKRKEGKSLGDFTEEDWKELGVETVMGTGTGAARGAVIYTMSNFTATPCAVASSLVTAAAGMLGQAAQLERGEITEEDFIINSEVITMDAAASAVSAILGEVLIPVPILGAVIGNAVGMFMYGVAKDKLSAREQSLTLQYKESMVKLERSLDERYRKLVEKLKQAFARFSSAVELAFDKDINIAFYNSVILATEVGVPTEKILRSKSDIDNYFTS